MNSETVKFRKLEQSTVFFMTPTRCEMRICRQRVKLHIYSPCIACIESLARHLYDQPTSSPSHYNTCLGIIPSLWWWKHHIYLQHWCQPTIVHGVKTQKTFIWKSCLPLKNQRFEIYQYCNQTWIRFSQTLNSSIPKLIYIITKMLIYPSCYSDTKVAA
jgi:hypothetical protein